MASSRLGVALVATPYFLSFSSIIITIDAQNLTAVKCNAKLPTGRKEFGLVYDKNDSIYLFGGSVTLKDAIKYSISEDTAQVVGQLPHILGDYGGGAVMDSLGNIFYLSGRNGVGIYHYRPDLRTFANVSNFPDIKHHFGTTTPDNDTALLFGGDLYPAAVRSITSLDLNSLQSQRLGQLPEGTSRASVIWVEGQGSAYVFDAYGRSIQKYHVGSNRTEKLDLQLPIEYMGNYGAVYDGRYAYLFGMIRDDDEVSPAQSLVRFDPQTETFSIIPVEGYQPVQEASAVYVEKLRRIYVFGGGSVGKGIRMRSIILTWTDDSNKWGEVK